jgi:putative transposase
MTPPIHTERDTRHRFPGEIISHGAWRYDGVHLSDRDVQALSCERGIDVTYEAIHPWCQQFGRDDANSGVAGDPSPGTNDLWHVDEMCLTIHGVRHDLWRAIDQDDHVWDILVQRQHYTKAAKTFFRTLLKGLRCVPRVIMTDQLKRDGGAAREVWPGVAHRQRRDLNHWGEHSHRPTRPRERRMQGFTSPSQAQRFRSAYGPMAQRFRPRRHVLSASAYRDEMTHRFKCWAEITGTARAASRVGRTREGHPCA